MITQVELDAKKMETGGEEIQFAREGTDLV